MKKMGRIGCALLVLSTGCSAFQPPQQHVSIAADVPSASLSVDNARVGTGRAELDLDRDRSHTVLATADGQSGTATIDKHVSATGVLDIIGGCFFLVPFVGCFTPGFWELSPTTVYVHVPQNP